MCRDRGSVLSALSRNENAGEISQAKMNLRGMIREWGRICYTSLCVSVKHLFSVSVSML